MYATALEHAGYLVLQAEDGTEAFSQAAVLVPSVVVSDLRLPGEITGVDLCRHFRQQSVPVVAVTGLSLNEVGPWPTDDCNKLLRKPVAPEELTETVHEMMRCNGIGQWPHKAVPPTP